MLLALLADIHGNLPALKTIVADAQRQEVDGFIVAGDLVGGPQPEETIHLLRSLDCQMIRGNGDTYLLRYSTGNAPIHWYTSKAFASMRWHFRHASRETLEFVGSLPEQRVEKFGKGQAIRIVHGSPRNPSESIFPNREPVAFLQALGETREPVLVFGHTHIPWQTERLGRLALNPGAVSGPLNGYVGAQYALLQWDGERWQAELCRVPYDLDLVRAAFQDSGLLEEGGAYSRSILYCIETGRNVTGDFLLHARRLAREAGIRDEAFVPDEIWDRASAEFAWPDTGRKARVRSVRTTNEVGREYLGHSSGLQ